jgi:hypothetical protein
MAARARTGFLLGLFLIALTAGFPAAAQNAKIVGKVVQQKGLVTVLRGDQPAVLILGANIFKGDRILTGAQSRVKVEFIDRTLVSIGPGTDIAVADYLGQAATEERPSFFSLLLGIARITGLPGSPRRDLQVKAKTAVASVRSTDWIIEAKQDVTSVLVLRGRVAVAGTHDGATVVLDPEFGTDVKRNAQPTAPKKWGAGRVRDVIARTSLP